MSRGAARDGAGTRGGAAGRAREPGLDEMGPGREKAPAESKSYVRPERPDLGGERLVEGTGAALNVKFKPVALQKAHELA